MFLEWQPRQWDGPFQYEDVATQELVMLPTDMALRDDPEFAKYAELYARDESTFFADFANAYGKMLSNGCPFHQKVRCWCLPLPRLPVCSCCNSLPVPDSWLDQQPAGKEEAGKGNRFSTEFREYAMHGSIEHCKKYVELGADIHEVRQNPIPPLTTSSAPSPWDLLPLDSIPPPPSMLTAPPKEGINRGESWDNENGVWISRCLGCLCGCERGASINSIEHSVTHNVPLSGMKRRREHVMSRKASRGLFLALCCMKAHFPLHANAVERPAAS